MPEPGDGPRSPLTTQPAGSPAAGAQDTPTIPGNEAPTIERAGSDSIVIHRPVEKPSYSPGDLLADRYRVIRFLAAGGMGEVYEAEDLTLGVRLALKTIKPEIARDPIAVERFKREINIARRITHPNISRIYDVGVHRGTGEPTTFLTMEFLAGETLKQLITRKERLTEEEALPLAEQIAAGLAAAHDTGIIHRDFKSPNVMLVTVIATGSGLPRMKAVVTDFGLARPETSEEGLATLSETGVISGTPAYMAPEQVEGKRLTPAADIYAFGIVLYEMVTGRRPFEGDSPMSVAIKRLTDQPVPPRTHVPTLDEVWNRTILRCLERDPAKRFANATDVAHALRTKELLPTPDDAPTARIVTSGSSRWRIRRIAPVAAIAIVVVAALFGLLYPNKIDAPQASANAVAPAVPLRRAVAVLPLRNNSGQPDAQWLATAIAEMMGTELSAGGTIRVAPGHDVARMASDLGITDGRDLSASERDRVRQSLGVDWLVAGSYTLIGQAPASLLRLDMRLINATNGATVRAHDATGSDRQLFDLVSRVGGVLRQPLGAGALSPADQVQVESSLPSNPEAARFYTEGLALLRAYDARGAVERLEQASKLDAHAFIHHALSSAYGALGNEAAAVRQSERALALSTKLSREQKLLIEARLHGVRRQWERAIEIERTLREMFPDSVEYGVSLADSQVSAGRTNEALATIQELRKLPKPASLDPRIDLVEALARQAQSDAARQRTLAQAAAAKARATGSRVLLARARFVEATALLALGNLEAANAAIDEAQSLFHAAGDESSVAGAVELTASSVWSRGDLEGAQKLYEQAYAAFDRAGNRTAAAQARINIGTILVGRGRSAEARPLFDQSLAALRQVGAKNAAAAALNDIGATLFYRDLEAARERYMQAFQLFSEVGDQSGQATALTNVGEVLACRGDLEEARRMHTESLAMNRAIRNKANEAYDLYRLGEILALRGDFRAARARYEEALKIQNETDGIAAADTQVALAKLGLEEGRPAAESERSARAAEETLRTQGATERATLAMSVVAEALLAQAKRGEALRIAEQAWSQAAESEDPRVRFDVAVTLAQVRAASRQPADVQAALAFLTERASEASQSDFVGSALEARLALGEMETAAGRASGRKRLIAVAAEAKAKGFERIAARAGGA